MVSENNGDIIYTEVFENYKNYAGFSIRLCRGHDPESKGKIESVIKYIKGNYLCYRTFYSISQLNSDGLKWLERRGNGQIHNSTKIVPSLRLQEKYERMDLMEAIEYCQKRELFSASDFGDTLIYLLGKTESKPSLTCPLPVKYSVIRAEERSPSIYTPRTIAGEVL